ncbi:MAG: TolB family protein, partial [Planctomycetota bacterium]
MNTPRHCCRALGAPLVTLVALGVTSALPLPAHAGAAYQKRASFAETMVATRERSAGASPEELGRLTVPFMNDFPVEYDWFSQDFIRPDPKSIRDERQRMAARLELQGAGKGGRVQVSKNLVRYMASDRDAALELGLIEKVTKELGSKGYSLKSKARKLRSKRTKVTDPAWLDLYVEACRARREKRMAIVEKSAQRVLFIKRRTIRPSFFAYTEGQSDAQWECHYHPGSSLCLWQTSNGKETVRTLIDSPDGMIRDLDVSWDGKRALFAWKKGRNPKNDDYHLYEMNTSTGKVRQLTQGKGVADFEGRYLPNGDILFNSSRCVETVDCWKTVISNLYTCDKDGKYLRRLGFDQVHTVYPSVLEDGNVIYTRWDYNDRSQMPPQPLFIMNPDGTGQTEYYGNNSYFPTTINHARGIPGTKKLLVVLHGHHTWQAGKLAIIDNKKGRQEGAGIDFVSPRRDIKKKYMDHYGQDEELFRHPWPLSETEYIVAMTPDRQARHSPNRFGLYLMDIDGNRELLHYDTKISSSHPTVLAPRKRPHQRVSTVDYSKDYGTYVMQDVYVGPGLKGIPRGTVKKLRVVGLDFRAAWI